MDFVRIVANKGVKKVGAVTSAERGSANKSGWMTGDDFVLFMEHFIKHTRVTKDKPVLLLLDNHQSHLDIKPIPVIKRSKARV